MLAIVPTARAGVEEVPDGAQERAARELAEWKIAVSRYPAFYRIDTLQVDVERAVLGRPYVLYILLEDADQEWNQSGDRDASGVATQRWFVFPIMVDEVCLGTLRVTANRREGGGKRDEKEGEFTTAGGTLPGDLVTFGVLALRERFPERDVGFVEAQWSGSFYILADSIGRLYRANYPYQAEPPFEFR